MIHKALLFVCNILLFSSTLIAQSPVERRNRTVFNRIEYFINTKQPDSVYTLASEEFKRSVDKQGFIDMISNMANYGKISNTEPVTFANNIAGYNVLLGSLKTSIHLGVDSNYKFNYFLVKPDHIQTVRKEEVKSNVNNQNPLDFYVDSIARAYLSNPNTKSLARGLINKNSINTSYYAQTDAANTASLPDETTLYETGSISKVFTSTLPAELVQKGTI